MFLIITNRDSNLLRILLPPVKKHFFIGGPAKYETFSFAASPDFTGSNHIKNIEQESNRIKKISNRRTEWPIINL